MVKTKPTNKRISFVINAFNVMSELRPQLSSYSLHSLPFPLFQSIFKPTIQSFNKNITTNQYMIKVNDSKMKIFVIIVYAKQLINKHPVQYDAHVYNLEKVIRLNNK